MADFYNRKQNRFYSEKIDYIDYKDVKFLQRYLTSVGKIEPRKRTGANMKHQRMLAKALKRARHIALLPYVVR